jgi:hypothetical protein
MITLPPYGGHPSQNDLFIIAKGSDGELIAIMIEGKVSESFGPTLARWDYKSSKGKSLRYKFIKEQLGISDDIPGEIRYQLLHRTVSAILEANRFNARYAMMLVHSFSQEDLWFDDYQNFVHLFGVEAAKPGRMIFLREIQGIHVYSGWARGEPDYLEF